MFGHAHRRLFSLPLLLRLPRVQVLRISLLLFLLQISTTLPSTSLRPLLTTILTTTLTTAIAIAATSSLLSLSTLLSNLFSRLLPPDAPFLNLYARAVLIVGPLATVFEAALVTYEVMAIARDAESRMWRSERNSGNWKRGIITACLTLMVGCAYIISVLLDIIDARFVIVVIGLIVLVSLVAPDGNLLESSVLSVYLSSLLFLTAIETNTTNDESRALGLLYTLLLTLLCVLRGPRFLKLVMVGYEEFRETNGGEEMFAAVAVPVVTFRVLVWTGGLHRGEYLAVLCRRVHMVCVLLFYGIFVRDK